MPQLAGSPGHQHGGAFVVLTRIQEDLALLLLKVSVCLSSDGIRLPSSAVVGACRGLSTVHASASGREEGFAKEVLAGSELEPLSFWAS